MELELKQFFDGDFIAVFINEFGYDPRSELTVSDLERVGLYEREVS